MKAVIQRVNRAVVSVNGELVGKCSKGLFILLGAAEGDSEKDAAVLAEKISKLRIFEDENGKMNLSIKDVGGEILSVSNFTLLADYSHGNRPSFIGALEPIRAKELYEYFSNMLNTLAIHTECGIFGADMKIDTECDGPVTIVMDSAVLQTRAGK